MKAILTLVLLVATSTVSASVKCVGNISDVYKWDNFEAISILLDISGQGKTRWISMPTKSDESMALMAFAAQKSVTIYMSEDSVTSCIDGWSNNKVLKGYFVVSNS